MLGARPALEDVLMNRVLLFPSRSVSRFHRRVGHKNVIHLRMVVLSRAADVRPQSSAYPPRGSGECDTAVSVSRRCNSEGKDAGSARSGARVHYISGGSVLSS